jgi:2-keto-4-pentenoate hydratase/2-oxohepta-3-ene-1,7-dioic acid hydratase in catechol pathway
VVTTKDEIPNPENVRLVTRLNGQVMQSATMDDLIFSIAEIVAHYAKYYRFSPGDIVTMGTPSGAGHGRKPPIYMKPGDRIEVEVDGVGQLANPIIAFENQPDRHAF